MRWSALIVSSALLVAPSIAFAQPARANTQAAQRAYDQGLVLYDADHFPEALAEFQSSFASYASPNPRLYIARCLRELGRLVEAAHEYEATIRRGEESARVERRYALTRDAARQELQALLTRLGRVTVVVASLPPAARVTVAGVLVPRDAMSAPVIVLPGRVEAVVEAEGFEPARGTVEITAGGEGRLELTLSQRGARPAVADNGGPLRALGWVGLGLGAAGFIGFGAFTVGANERYQHLLDTCGPMPCLPSQRGALDVGRTYETLAYVSLGVGVVGLVAGGIMLIASIRRPPPAGLQVRLTTDSLTLSGVF